VLHWAIINNDIVICRVSTSKTREQVFLNRFQKQIFLGSLYFLVRYLPPIILDSDPIAGLLTQNIKRLHGQVLKQEVTNRLDSGYSHGAPDSDICHIAKFCKEPFTEQPNINCFRANEEWNSAGVGLLADHIRLPLWHQPLLETNTKYPIQVQDYIQPLYDQPGDGWDISVFIASISLRNYLFLLKK
jgi:hypothetical protein